MKKPISETTFKVQVLRSGQPRPYADTEREYLISCTIETQVSKNGPRPWLMYGDVEATIRQEEKWRAEGKMRGGHNPDELRRLQREWARKLVRTLCQNFREKDDDDGRTGMEAHFFPTLKSLDIDPKAGTVRAFIVEPYTD